MAGRFDRWPSATDDGPHRMSKKGPREKDMTARYMSGDFDDDRVERQQRFSDKSKHHQQRKIEKTTLMRLAGSEAAVDPETLPVGQVVQVYSLFSEVKSEGQTYLCVVRKTLNKVSETPIVVGDLVRFRASDVVDPQGRPAAVIEVVLPRKSVLTRADSFKAMDAQPIVANAEQMLIVASLVQPRVKWGLIDRMVIAAVAGHLTPVICLNKIDLADEAGLAEAEEILGHYGSLGLRVLKTSVLRPETVGEITELLRGKETVLAGHSGVGKSSLIRAVQPSLDLRVGAISGYTGKGRHTTTSARRYPLEIGGAVIDTPGVKLFGLWGVTAENLDEFFPDVADETAPEWRRESYQRIRESLG